jgi:hypothetical protein
VQEQLQIMPDRPVKVSHQVEEAAGVGYVGSRVSPTRIEQSTG